MPITKSETNGTILQFGQGDIVVSAGHIKDPSGRMALVPAIQFGGCQPGPVREIKDQAELRGPPEVTILFDSPAPILFLIQSLAAMYSAYQQ